MSHQAVAWAMYDAPMLLTDAGKPDSTARQVLAVLGEKADAGGFGAFPSPVLIAYATGLDERTVERALRRLERGGLIARDGIYRGCTRWRLVLSRTRSKSDEEEFRARAEQTKRVESDRRQARRNRSASASVDVSGTQNAGHARAEGASGIDHDDCVRHGKCGCPARRMPDVRHAAPPEPPVEPPGNHQAGGRAAPQSPRRPKAPPSSGPWNEQRNLINEGETKPPQNRTTTSAARGTAPVDNPTNPRGEIKSSVSQPRGANTPPREGRCPHGRNSRRRGDGQPRCDQCREKPEQVAQVIPLRRASGGST